MIIKHKVISIFAILLFATAACSPTKSSTPDNTGSSVEATLIPTQQNTKVPSVPISNNACTNPLYPVVVGATWSYLISGPPESNLVRSIQELSSDGFTDQDEFSAGVTRTDTWKCQSGTLTALDPSGNVLGTASVAAGGMETDFQTTNIDGVTLPAVVTEGTTWSQNITLEGVQTINDVEIASTLTISNDCTGAGEELVTVTAGTFNARIVNCIGMVVITINMSGMDIPITTNSTSTTWYSEGVGMVKTISDNSDGTKSSIELIEYNIP
ncbi:hypothetical protein ACFLTX_02505 [Chloroflexota bacterium]